MLWIMDIANTILNRLKCHKARIHVFLKPTIASIAKPQMCVCVNSHCYTMNRCKTPCLDSSIVYIWNILTKLAIE